MTKIKPIYLMHQEGVTPLETAAAIDGANEMIQLAGVNGIQIHDFGVWRMDDWKEADGSLKREHSVDWFIEKCKAGLDVDANSIGMRLEYEKWRQPKYGGRDHHDLVLISDKLFTWCVDRETQKSKKGPLIGIGGPALGALVSTHFFRQLDDRTRYETTKTAVMHEIGHAFGLLPKDRTEMIETGLGKHCADNTCIMRQGYKLPDDWVKHTKDRLEYGPLCGLCTTNLTDYFKE